MLPLYPFPLPKPLPSPDVFTVSIILACPECHTVGITQYLAFSNWVSSLSNLHLGSSTSLHGWLDTFFLSSVQFSSHSHVRLFASPWIAARQASLFITNSWQWWIIFHSLDVPVYLSTHSLKDIFNDSRFWLLWIKLH